MKKQILILVIVFFTSFSCTFTMEPKKKFKFFSELPQELQMLVLIELQNVESVDCPTFFEKIIKSYQSIKKLSQTCKRFKQLEKEQRDHLLKELNCQLPLSCLETTIHMFQEFLKPFVESLDIPSDQYELMFRWLCNKPFKSTQILKAALIILRTLESENDELKVLRTLWLNFETKTTTPLHSSCIHLNKDLTKYLTNPTIISYFNININAIKCQKTPLDSIPKVSRSTSCSKKLQKRDKRIKKITELVSAVIIP